MLRSLAKQLAKEDWRTYLKEARDDTYEEIMLQGLVIGYVKAEMEELLEYAAAFIPKIHDWSVNDGFCSTFKIVRKHRAEVWDFLMQYRASESEFEQRVVAVMLMDHFLVPEYIGRVLAVYNSLKHEGYYCKWESHGELRLLMQNFRRRPRHFCWKMNWMIIPIIRQFRKCWSHIV